MVRTRSGAFGRRWSRPGTLGRVRTRREATGGAPTRRGPLDGTWTRGGAFGVVLALGGCCVFADFDRDVVVTHRSGLEVGALDDGQALLNSRGIPVPHFALRAGDTATFHAQAEETYFGDSGCEPEGLLGPSSAQDPGGFRWAAEDAAIISVSPGGLVEGQSRGESLLQVERRTPRVTGGALIRVLPWFDSISVQATRDTVAVGDTVTVIVTALRDGAHVEGIDFRSAGLGATPSPSGALANSIFSVLDDSPVRVVFIAQAPGPVTVGGAHRVVSYGAGVGMDSLTVVP